MKYLTQVVTPILIVAAIIGGITFVVQYTGLRKKAAERVGPAVVSADDLLYFSQRKAQWSDDEREDAAEFEVGTRYHYDFRFENRSSDPVSLGLESKSCACSDVSTATATPGAATAGAPTAEDAWQRLEPKGPTVTIPAANTSGPAVGWVRLSWQGRQEGLERLNVLLRAEQGFRGRQPIPLTAVVRFVPPFQVEATAVKVKELTTSGQQEAVEFYCWSATRPQFPLTVKEATASKTVSCEAQALTPEQCKALASARKERVQAGYRVRVTVHERRDGALLDLGPFQRKLLLTGPADRPPIEVTLSGMVRGEVAVLSAEEADGIPLRSFAADMGTEKTVAIVSDQAGAQLRLESWTPESLEVKLGRPKTIDGRQRWDLVVKVPPRAVVGALPDDSAIVLRIDGATPRRMRLPLSGQGTQ